MRRHPAASSVLCLTIMLAIIGLFTACNDDDNGPAAPSVPEIEGGYQILTMTPRTAGGDHDPVEASPQRLSEMAVWIRFESDDTYSVLEESSSGLRRADVGVYLLTDSQVVLSSSRESSGSGAVIYNCNLDGDALTLTRTDETITAMREAAAPLLTDWLVPLTPLDSVPSPVADHVDLAYDGTSVWVGNARVSDNIYALDPATLTVMDAMEIDREGWALEWRGSELWTSHDGSSRIFRIDTTTGIHDFDSTEMGSWIYGIAWDGTSLWCLSNSERTLYEYDPVGDAVLSTVDFTDASYGPGGMTYADGYLYLCYGGVVNQCTTSPFEVVGAFQLEGYYVSGITSDGTNLYLTAYPRNHFEVEIFKTAMPVTAR